MEISLFKVFHHFPQEETFVKANSSSSSVKKKKKKRFKIQFVSCPLDFIFKQNLTGLKRMDRRNAKACVENTKSSEHLQSLIALLLMLAF